MTPDTIERIAKLIPMLGASIDGEVLGTVAAINRVLAKGGCSLHDLASHLRGSASSGKSKPAPGSYAAQRPNPFEQAAYPGGGMGAAGQAAYGRQERWYDEMSAHAAQQRAYMDQLRKAQEQREQAAWEQARQASMVPPNVDIWEPEYVIWVVDFLSRKEGGFRKMQEAQFCFQMKARAEEYETAGQRGPVAMTPKQRKWYADILRHNNWINGQRHGTILRGEEP